MSTLLGLVHYTAPGRNKYLFAKDCGSDTVGTTNFKLLSSFKKWCETRDLQDEDGYKDDIILYSGGPLLCNREGYPITTQQDTCLMTYLSTSTCEQVAENFRSTCMYKIKVPCNLIKYLMPVEDFSCIKGEYEVILPLGTILRFLGESSNDEDHTLRCIELEMRDYDMEVIDEFIEIFGRFKRTLATGTLGGHRKKGGTQSCKYRKTDKFYNNCTTCMSKVEFKQMLRKTNRYKN
jgi:hypothetical protein